MTLMQCIPYHCKIETVFYRATKKTKKTYSNIYVLKLFLNQLFFMDRDVEVF